MSLFTKPWKSLLLFDKGRTFGNLRGKIAFREDYDHKPLRKGAQWFLLIH